MNRRKAGDSGVLLANLQRRVAASGLDDARKFLLLDVIETYSGLSDDERARYETLISRKEYQTVLEEKLTWSDRMRAEGAVEAKRETLLRLLKGEIGSAFPGNDYESNGRALCGRTRRSPRTYPLGDGARRDGALGLRGSFEPEMALEVITAYPVKRQSKKT